ncbi:MAG: 3-oxoacyl-ACP synthase III family protein, partial [Blastocatellia bacterium]
PDLQVPGIGSIVHHKLGLASIPAVDLRAACSSILYSLQISRALIESGAAGVVLSCAAEAQSKGLILDSQNAEISMLFGDGAGAFITASAPRPGACNLRIDDVLIETDGCFALDLCVKSAVGLGAHASNVSVTANADLRHAGLQQDEARPAYTHFPVMNGRVVILQAVRKLTEAAVKLLDRNGMKAEGINLIVPHQANLNLLNAVAKRLSVPMGRVAVNLDRYGNTSSASAFIALSDAWQQGRLITGGKILFLAFGAGFTWGAALCTCV